MCILNKELQRVHDENKHAQNQYGNKTYVRKLPDQRTKQVVTKDKGRAEILSGLGAVAETAPSKIILSI